MKSVRKRAAIGKQSKRLLKPGKPRMAMVDIAQKRERCVLLLSATDSWGSQSPKVVAWYPDSGIVARVSNTLMPPLYRPLDSCGGFVCGLHTDSFHELKFDWKFRVAVSNPVTKYQVELPVLDISHLPAASRFARMELVSGSLRLVMTPPLREQELFCVHITTSCSGEHTVHSFNTSLWCWESSTGPSGQPIGRQLVGDLLFPYRNLRSYDVATRKWTSIAGPEEGQPWDADFPVPERFSGRRYENNLFPFRHEGRIMAACTLNTGDVVLLELGEGGEGWKVVITADDPCELTPHRALKLEWLAVRGDLLVLPFPMPMVLNLKHRRLNRFPRALVKSSRSLHCACVYEP